MLASKGKKKTQKKQLTATHVTWSVIAITVAFVAWSQWPTYSETSFYDRYLSDLGVKRARLEITCTGEGQDRACRLRAKRPINEGEKVVHVPEKALIHAGTVHSEEAFKAAFENNGGEAMKILGDAGMMHLHNAFMVTFKIWHEMKLGTSSPMWAWFDLLPKVSEINNVLYFTKDEIDCADQFTQNEYNSSMTVVQKFTEAAKAACSSGIQCKGLDEGKLFDEMKLAFAYMRQRTWGDYTQSPLIVPVVDFGFSHAPLCAPKILGGDGDEECQGRDRRFGLQPQQNEDKSLSFHLLRSSANKGDLIFSLPKQQAPWETLATHGYADFATGFIADFEIQLKMRKLVEGLKILEPTRRQEKFPLKPCLEGGHNLGWNHQGSPKSTLRNCWALAFYFSDEPDVAKWDEEAHNNYEAFQKDKARQAKYNFLAARALVRSAKGLTYFLQESHDPKCSSETGRLVAIKKTREIALRILEQAQKTSEQRAVNLLATWKKYDSNADENIQDPEIPSIENKEESVEEVAETVEGDAEQ